MPSVGVLVILSGCNGTSSPLLLEIIVRVTSRFYLLLFPHFDSYHNVSTLEEEQVPSRFHSFNPRVQLSTQVFVQSSKLANDFKRLSEVFIGFT